MRNPVRQHDPKLYQQVQAGLIDLEEAMQSIRSRIDAIADAHPHLAEPLRHGRITLTQAEARSDAINKARRSHADEHQTAA